VSTKISFPSKKWFEALAERMTTDAAAFRKLGPVDCTMVVKVDADGRERCIRISFEGFRIKSIRELESMYAAPLSHFVVEGPLHAWREMIENVQANGGPDREHTLNYLTFPDDPLRVTGPSQLEIDAFYRYNESLQRFFNGAAKLPTSYAQ
jgi:hypothetical protein